MIHKKFTPRDDYRRQEGQRAKESASLSEKFRDLTSLTVEFGYFSPEGLSRNRQIKYTVNPDHAKSVFRLDCLNEECVGGDYDLSEALSQAVVAHRPAVTGEMCCQGWLGKTSIDRIHCHNIMRYKLSLEYELPMPAEMNRELGALT